MKSGFRWKGVSMITDFETWLLDVGFDRTFRLLEYRRPGDWTPYETEKKYIDESHYRDNHYALIKIKEAIELPDGDILIGYIDVSDVEDFWNFDDKNEWINCRKLSEIELCWNPEDDKYLEDCKEEELNDGEC